MHACVHADESPRGHPPVGRPRCTHSLLSAPRRSAHVGITFDVGLTYRKLVYVFCNCRAGASNPETTDGPRRGGAGRGKAKRSGQARTGRDEATRRDTTRRDVRGGPGNVLGTVTPRVVRPIRDGSETAIPNAIGVSPVDDTRMRIVLLANESCLCSARCGEICDVAAVWIEVDQQFRVFPWELLFFFFLSFPLYFILASCY